MTEESKTSGAAASEEVAEAGVTTPAEKLKQLGVEDEMIAKIIEDLGVETTDDLGRLNEADLVMIGMRPIPARNLLASLSPAAPAADTVVQQVSFDILPSVPDDDSWLKALKAGGVLKIEDSTVISAVRATLANRVGLYDVPAKLVTAMERFADESEEQVDPMFFDIRKQLTRRSYAEIFEAVPGLDGTYVTAERKNKLLSRMNTEVWPSIIGFYGHLRAWQESWLEGVANPGMMMLALMNPGGGPLPPGAMQPPDTGNIRAAAEAVNDAINRAFAGTGVQIAAALAYDASKIKETLMDSRLPALVGVANRELMLKKLDVAVPPTYPRLEQNLTRFVLGTIKADEVAAGDAEVRYFSTLLMLGREIPELDSRPGGLSGIGRDRL